jgi:glutamine amidotransferase
VRKATQGSCTVFNCHPFQHGRWVFAHNGDIRNFDTHREALLAEVGSKFRRFILGDTDSEILFFVFLTQLAAAAGETSNPSLEHAITALRACIRRVREICDNGDPAQNALLTVMATNGEMLVATQGGKELYFSTYKKRCSDRDHCPSLSPVCEAPSKTGLVNHFIVSSEPLQGENVWEELRLGDIVGVDRDMRMQRTHLERTALPVVA